MAIVDAYPSQSIPLGGSTVTVTRDSVGATAAALVAANPKRSQMFIKNTHATQILYVSAADDVATTDGFAIGAGETLPLHTTSALYAIASGATTTYAVIEVIV